MLKKIQFAPGVNSETTRYSSEGGWVTCNNVRFRNGFPEKIGGWTRLSAYTYLGVCRSLNNWATLGGQNLVGVGTNIKFYIERGGYYYDVTPIRSTVSLTDPFTTTNGDTTVVVDDVDHGCFTGDFVIFSGASPVGGLLIDGEYEVTVINADSYTIEAASAATSSVTGGGTVTAEYEINTGSPIALPITGFGAGEYGSGPWGVGSITSGNLGMWSQSNFGEDLIFAQRNGQICLWDATNGTSTRGVLLEDEVGASDVPVATFIVLVSDASRFVFAFGANDIGSSTLDPMLIRWSDQEDALNWTPSATNQAGSIRLSIGSEIVAAHQSRQEILVWTDAALYSLQYIDSTTTWAPQLVGDNISIVGPLATAYANGVSFWMGNDKFYSYNGAVKPLRCDVRRYVFSDFNFEQRAQVCAGTNEQYHEVWWFYCTADSDEIDRYVVYNYLEDIWMHGDVSRTAWLDSQLRPFPLAATYSNNLVYHEDGVDDVTSGIAEPITASITSGQFDIDDGEFFGFAWRALPDFQFTGSTAANPTITLSFTPYYNAGSGPNDPTSVGGSSSGVVTRTVEVPIEEFTGQINLRVRGRQMVMHVESSDLGIMWQLGSVRFDVRPSGRK